MLCGRNCFNSQPPEGGWLGGYDVLPPQRRFNSQPPEGGWCISVQAFLVAHGFNSQPPEGGWTQSTEHSDTYFVSTHSRPKAAGKNAYVTTGRTIRFNSQPPEGGWAVFSDGLSLGECFNSQPPEGGW